MSAANAAEPLIGPDGVRTFPPEYYADFQPKTALDLVSRTPGFQIREEASARGLAKVRSNILIDGARPPPKGKGAAVILREIAAQRVDRLDLIPAGARPEIDMQGFDEVLNVVTRKEVDLSYEAIANYSRQGVGDPATTNGDTANASLRSTWSKTPHQFTAGASVSHSGVKSPSGFAPITPEHPEQRVTSVTTSVTRSENFDARGEIDLGGASSLAFDGQFGRQTSKSAPIDLESAAGETEFLRNSSDFASRNYKLSAAFRTPVSKGAQIEVALTQSRAQNRSTASQADSAGLRETIAETQSGETGGRIELKWRADETLTVGSTISGAYNFLDGASRLLIDGEEAPFAADDIVVDERRGGASFDLDWRPAGRINIQGAAGVEAYELATDDFSSGWKTSLTSRLSLNVRAAKKTHFVLESTRSVGQLDFGQFLASASLDSNIITAGAEELEPEARWRHALSFEHRFGERGVVNLTLARDVVLNPIGTVPLSETIFAAQNAASAATDTLSANVAYPLDPLGLAGAIFSSNGSLARSETIDPVTGEMRAVSNEPTASWSIGVTKDRGEDEFFWGASLSGTETGRGYSPRSVSSTDSSLNWSGHVEWRGIEDVKLRASLSGPVSTSTTTELFRSPRRAGLAPDFFSLVESKAGIGVSASAEWRMTPHIELLLSASSGIRHETRSTTTGDGFPGPFEQSFPRSPLISLQLRNVG